MWDLVGNPKDWFSHNEAHMNTEELNTITKSIIKAPVIFNHGLIWTYQGLSAMFFKSNIHRVQRMMISVDKFFCIFKIIIFCCVVAICDLVHGVEAMYSLP